MVNFAWERPLAAIGPEFPGLFQLFPAGCTKKGGERVYENRYVIWGRLRWGLLREYEVYEDTQRAKALDEYLARVGKP